MVVYFFLLLLSPIMIFFLILNQVINKIKKSYLDEVRSCV